MSHPDLWPPVDPLGEALHLLRMSGSFYCRSEFRAPFGIALPAMHDCLMFHVVTAGHCWLEVDGDAPRALHPGDLVVLPHGEGHRLASTPGAPAARLFDLPREAVSERYEILRHGGRGAETLVICGAVRFEQPTARHLVTLLPRVLRVDGSGSRHAEWIRSTLAFMAEEARVLRPGGEAVITRLADVLVIQAIRAWIEEDPSARTGWLGALQDRQIGRAVALMHRDPAHPWTLASLASEVAMSRSAFAARFTALVGVPAMRYLARWRMHVASTLLREDGPAVADLAGRLGYRSEAAFSRAFKRVSGDAPGAARRRSTAGPR